MNTSATGGFLQPETGLARSDIARLIGDVITPPASSAPGVPDDLRWSGRADLTLTFRRGPSSPQGKAAEGTVAITHAEQPDCGIRGN